MPVRSHASLNVLVLLVAKPTSVRLSRGVGVVGVLAAGELALPGRGGRGSGGAPHEVPRGAVRLGGLYAAGTALHCMTVLCGAGH